MSDANSSTMRIIPVFHPVRIARPDRVNRRWIITSPLAHRIQVTRHWNIEHGVTEVCQCQPACATSREDYFTGALQAQGQGTDGAKLWEPVVLHLTEQTVRSIYLLMRSRNDDGDLQGNMVSLERQGTRANDRVVCRDVQRGRITSATPMIDVAQVVLFRLRITTDFFGQKLLDDDAASPQSVNVEQVIPPARARNDKPRVAKGRR